LVVGARISVWELKLNDDIGHVTNFWIGLFFFMFLFLLLLLLLLPLAAAPASGLLSFPTLRVGEVCHARPAKELGDILDVMRGKLLQHFLIPHTLVK
jgi:hypothetical protein